LLERGQAILNSEADLRREIRLLAGLEVGTLMVGAGPYASEISVAAAIARLANAHPHLKIQFSTVDPVEVVRDVLAERIDVGVAEIAGPNEDARLVVEPLPSHRIVLACRPSHPLAKEKRPSLARVREFPLVTTLLRGNAAETATTEPVTESFIPQISVNSLTLARLIARDSDALFPGTVSMLAEDIAAGRLTLLDFDVPAMRTNYGVIHLQGRTLTPSARAFIETLRTVEAEAQMADTHTSSSAT
jgi:DNA-binding transcriptional LysR family regulator